MSTLSFCFRSVPLIDPLLRPEYILLHLEQREKSLEGHTRLFLVFSSLTTYPDDALVLEPILPPLWSGHWREINLCSLPVSWRNSPVPLPTHCPVHHFPTVRSPPMTESQSQLQGATELRIATEPKLRVPLDQVSEPVTTPTTREKAVANEIAEGSSAHCNMPEGDLIDLLTCPLSSLLLWSTLLEGAPISEFSPERAPVPKLSPERAPVSKSSPEKHSVPKFSPERAPVSKSNPKRHSVPKGIPKSPEALPPAPPSSSAVVWPAPLLTLSPPSVQWACRGPASLHRCYGWRIPCLPVDSAAPPWLLAPYSLPWPSSPLAPPGYLIPPAMPWSVFDHPAPRDSTSPASPRPSVPPAPSGSSNPPTPPWSSVASASPWPPGSTPLCQSLLPSAPA
ncbi:Streptococcal surface protein A [Labeo rohita]|uniref:Streptococcal surface protein A n=1 Tax=Labeo rohita TaxID=84645 RepID=A0ABQ8M4D3_LABRO|nr:Streptococcal surface protein A [Labeo rohita]